jgi:hypothetical protein
MRSSRFERSCSRIWADTSIFTWKPRSLALETDDPDVARKAAEFMIDKVSARRADGKVERLIEAPASEPNGPRIQIGIALGGVPAAVTARTD